jgi:hypothetical protein
MPDHIKSVSPTRSYVAVCNTTNFDGYYLKFFELPHIEKNTRARAAWYFLNKLNAVACLELILTTEEYFDETEDE